MPLKDSTETKMGCQERRGGRMGSWSDLVWIVDGRKWIKRSDRVWRQHLRTLQPKEAKCGKRKENPWTTPSSLPRRNYEITPRTPSVSRGDLAARQTELEEHLATIARKKKAKSKGQLLTTGPQEKRKPSEAAKLESMAETPLEIHKSSGPLRSSSSQAQSNMRRVLERDRKFWALVHDCAFQGSSEGHPRILILFNLLGLVNGSLSHSSKSWRDSAPTSLAFFDLTLLRKPRSRYRPRTEAKEAKVSKRCYSYN
ncbi:hypothetical protein E6C27_scaffold48253G00010 [Cucumis melo var. makuwa]|uniref:Uncharacterized protein n=1 Tax=Cucumis melo var. makuwa TaxID=1194695 RepID=A0A5A7SZE6_CUCMM|nr:hypothetical protein E6C27_scaffold48253G00010 [Cucumis melo var. makuwa]